MSLKRIFSVNIMVIAVMAFSLAGCTQPPTEKVSALQADLAMYESQGAGVFAAAEFSAVSGAMTELQSLLDAKQNKEATVLADSLRIEMDALKSTLETNAKAMAEQAVANAEEGLINLKSLLTPQNSKVLGAAAAQFTTLTAELESKVGAVKSTVQSADYMAAYTDANQLVSQISTTVQDVTAQLEAAMAKKTVRRR